MSSRQRSHIWRYFSKNSMTGKAVCNICKHSISYQSTIANLKGHLQRRHFAVYTELISKTATDPKYSRTVQITNYEVNALDISDPMEQDPAPSTSGHGASIIVTTSAAAQPPAKRISTDQTKLIDRDLLDLFIKDFQPFNMIDDVGFSKLMKRIPGYSLPRRKTLSEGMIPILYNKCLESAMYTVLHEAESVCITMDFWTSSTAESYLAITGHFITKEFQFKSVLLKCCEMGVLGSHAEIDLATGIRNAIKEWNLQDKVNFVVSDNARHLSNAIEEILNWKHYGCFAHKLNAIIKQSLLEIQPTLEKVKETVGHFRRNPSANEKLLKYPMTGGLSHPKFLAQDVANQWTSTLEMLQRFVQLEEAITATVAVVDQDWPILISEEWETCRQVCEILSPFEEMIKSVSGAKYMTGSSVIVVTKCLKGICEKLEDSPTYSKASKRVISALERGLVDHFFGIENDSTFALCTLLDPRYKDRVFQDSAALEAAKTELRSSLEKRMAENSKGNLSEVSSSQSESLSAWSILNELMADKEPRATPSSKVVKEMENYLKDDVLPRLDERGEHNCPLDWWKKYQYIYPNLAEVFRKKCNVVATSVPSDRIFTERGNLIHDRRSKLTSTKVGMVVFLNGNAEMNV